MRRKLTSNLQARLDSRRDRCGGADQLQGSLIRAGEYEGEICGLRWHGMRPNLIYTSLYRGGWALSIFGYGLLDYKSFRLAMQAAGGLRQTRPALRFTLGPETQRATGRKAVCEQQNGVRWMPPLISSYLTVPPLSFIRVTLVSCDLSFLRASNRVSFRRNLYTAASNEEAVKKTSFLEMRREMSEILNCSPFLIDV